MQLFSRINQRKPKSTNFVEVKCCLWGTISQTSSDGYYRKLRITFRPRARKGLGISSFSGSHTAGGSRSEDLRPEEQFEVRESLAHRLRSSTGRPPARAWASSTSVLPPILRCITALNISSPPPLTFVGCCFKPDLRVGDPASAAKFADDGIFDRRRWGDLALGSP